MFCAPLFVAGTDIMGGAGDQANDVTVEEMEAAIRRNMNTSYGHNRHAAVME